MQLTISTWDDRIITVELDSDDPVENLRAILEVETGVPGSQQALLHNGRELKEGKLGEQQVQAGDLILLMQRQVASRSQVQQPAAAAGGVPAGSQNPLSLNPDGSASNPEFLIQTLNNPQQLSQLPPDLADAVRGGDIAKLQDQLQKIHRMRREAAEEERRFLRMAEEDPFNPGAVRGRSFTTQLYTDVLDKGDILGLGLACALYWALLWAGEHSLPPGQQGSTTPAVAVQLPNGF